MKRCACCGEEKSSEAFCKDTNAKDGRKCYCRLCSAMKQKQITPEKAREYQNKWRSKNGEKVRAKGRALYAADPLKAKLIQQRYHEKHKEKIAIKRRASTLKQYRLTPSEYDAMLRQQANACACCQSTDPSHWSGRFQVDHDHISGAVRGLLCSGCNGGLGLFKDDMERLRKAIQYIAASVGKEPAQIATAGFFRAS